jgi:hypothetical protein
MRLEDLDSIEWDELESTEDWVKMLNDLLGLVDGAQTPTKRDALAAALDEFADRSTSEDLSTITKLDAAARKAARALRKTDIAASVNELAAASADFRAALKELGATTAELKKEAAKLRSEKITAAVSSLTETIGSLKNLSQVLESEAADRIAAADKVAAAIKKAVQSAQKLRTLLERPA